VTEQQPLWEFDHPYYCSESNFYSRDCHNSYSSWESFVESEGDNDFDMNLVFRWDWKADEYFDEDTIDARREYASRFGDRDHAWTLSVFWILQRKGIFRCTEVKVCKANEPAVRDWLTRRAEHMKLLWEPLIQASASEPGTGEA
jgi:hypothetical protein